MSWTDYVTRVTGGEIPADIARRTGIASATVSRWWSAGMQPSHGSIRAVASAYGRPLIEALVAADVLTEAEAGVREVERVVRQDITALTDDELVSELLARLRGREHAKEEPEPIEGSRRPTSGRKSRRPGAPIEVPTSGKPELSVWPDTSSLGELDAAAKEIHDEEPGVDRGIDPP